jgi:integrase/recombinase XerD
VADHIHGFLLWMQHARARSENTVRAYGDDVRMFVAFCEKSGITDTEQVTFHHVEAFGAVQRGHLGLSETTVARRRSALGQFFLYLERHDLVRKNPAKLAIGMKIPPRRPPEYMTQAERERILEVLSNRGSRRGRRNYALFALMFLSGLRVSEVCHLKVEDADLEGQKIYVRAGKGRKDRRVPITPRLVRILRLWLPIRATLIGAASPWLFLHMWGHHKFGMYPLNTKAIYNQVRLQIVPILGRKVTPHTFRHSYITHIWEESDNLRIAQHLAGHESIRTTSAYCHVTPRKERERLVEYLGESRAARRRAPSDEVGPTRRDATSGRWLKNQDTMQERAE